MADHLKPTRIKLTIMSALATGWLPWGVNWQRSLHPSGKGYALCCGHVLSGPQAEAFLSAGMLQREDGGEKLEITDAGREWLRSNWR